MGGVGAISLVHYKISTINNFYNNLGGIMEQFRENILTSTLHLANIKNSLRQFVTPAHCCQARGLLLPNIYEEKMA